MESLPDVRNVPLKPLDGLLDASSDLSEAGIHGASCVEAEDDLYKAPRPLLGLCLGLILGSVGSTLFACVLWIMDVINMFLQTHDESS